MSTEQIDRCLRELLPAEAVRTDPAALESAGVRNPLVEPGAPPTHVVRPVDGEQLQALVGQANAVGMNLTVSSSAGGHVRGGACAVHPAVRVDLSGWNAVPWIDRRNRVCLIQPGVSYGALLEALAPHGMTVPTPLAPRSGKSVLAAVMDREPSTWPNRQWDSSDPVASTEFLFGSGERFRTGAAGGPGSLEAQRAAGGAQKSPLGPSQADFHRVVQGAQGCMGIVTWITIRTERRAAVEKPFLLGAERLEPLISFVYEVQRSCLGEQSFLLDRTAAAMLLSGTRAVPFHRLRSSLPRYVCLQNIAGFGILPRARVRYQERDIRAMASRHGVTLNRALGRLSARDLLTAATRPCGDTDWRHAWKGHCLSVFFLTTLDRVPGLEASMRALAGPQEPGGSAVGCYIQPVVQNHACHVEFLLPYDPGDAGGVERMRCVEKEAVKRMAGQGAFFSRPYGSAAGVVFGQNPLNFQVLRRVKEVFDPRRVMNRAKWDL